MTTQALAKSEPKPPQRPSALNLMASRLSCDPVKLLATLKATVFKNANDEEVMALVLVANEYGLNPLLKELYAFPAKGGGICPIVSVDGWNKMLLRQESYNGKKFTFERAEDGSLISCTAFIYVKGREYPEEITEYFNECVRNTDNWKNMPHRMLRNRTLCQASRMAFGFSGIYHEDEAATITVESTVIPSDLPPKMVAAPEKLPALSEQSRLESQLLVEGITLGDFAKFTGQEGLVADADSLTAFSEVPTEVAKRLLKNIIGLVNGIKLMKGTAK